MAKICVILVFILLSFLFFYKKRYKVLEKKKIFFSSSLNYLEKQKSNPDIDTDNWDLHKLRLKKFKRSQYKGLTFFVSAENRIYYLSEKGAKVYC